MIQMKGEILMKKKTTNRLASPGAVWTKCSSCGYLHVFHKSIMNKKYNKFNCRGCGEGNAIEGLK